MVEKLDDLDNFKLILRDLWIGVAGARTRDLPKAYVGKIGPVLQDPLQFLANVCGDIFSFRAVSAGQLKSVHCRLAGELVWSIIAYFEYPVFSCLGQKKEILLLL